MEKLEKQCEDALFELCDARERFPERCAKELQKCIRLNKEINMMKVTTKPIAPLDILASDQHIAILNNYIISDHESYKTLDKQFDVIAERYDNLKAVLQQAQREKDFEINKLVND